MCKEASTGRYGLWLYDVFIYLGVVVGLCSCLFSCLTRIYNSIDFQFLFQAMQQLLASFFFIVFVPRSPAVICRVLWPRCLANKLRRVCVAFWLFVIVAKYAAGGKV